MNRAALVLGRAQPTWSMAFLRIVKSFELVLKSFESKSEKSFRSSFIVGMWDVYGAGERWGTRLAIDYQTAPKAPIAGMAI